MARSNALCFSGRARVTSATWSSISIRTRSWLIGVTPYPSPGSSEWHPTRVEAPVPARAAGFERDLWRRAQTGSLDDRGREARDRRRHLVGFPSWARESLAVG